MSGAGLRGVRRWTDEQIQADVDAARQDFRRRRMGEPLQRYLGAFDLAQPEVNRLTLQLEGCWPVVRTQRQSCGRCGRPKPSVRPSGIWERRPSPRMTLKPWRRAG